MSDPEFHPQIRLVQWLVKPRNQGIFAIISLCCLVVFLASFYVFVPNDGLQTENKDNALFVTSVHKPALEADFIVGDKILKIQDRPVVSQRGPIYPAGVGKGDEIVYEIERSGESLRLTVVMGGYLDNLKDFGPIFGVQFLAVSFWLIGAILCLFSAYGDKRARLVGLGWLLASVAAAAGGPGITSHFWGVDALTVSFNLLGVVLVVVHLYFPKKSFSIRVRKTVIHSIGILALMLISLHFIFVWIFGVNVPQTTIASYWFFFLSLTGSIALLVKNRISPADPTVKRQTGIILWTTVLSFGPFMVLTLVPILFFRQPYLDGKYSILFLVLLPLAYAYVINQRALIKIDFIINRITVFFILILLILFVSITGLGLVALVFDLSPDVPLLGGMLATIIALPSAIVQRKIQVSVNRVLYGSYYDYSSVTSKLSNNLVQALNRKTLVELLTEDVAEEMGILQTALILPDERKLTLQTPCDVVFEVSPDEEPCQFLLDAGIPVRAANFWGLVSEASKRRWDLFSWAELFVPLVLEKRLYGILILGPRVASEIYSNLDLQIIATVAQQGALATANLKLVEDLRGLTRRLVRTDEEQRKRLARDLHDAVLQNLFFVKQRMLQIDQRETIGYLDEVIDTLRRTIKAQRTSLLDQGLILALSDLVQDMQHLAGEDTPIDWVQDDRLNGLRLTDEQATTFYRIAQEAISNTLKHAQADKIKVRLSRIEGKDGDKIHLVVEDDGLGLKKDDRSRKGHYGFLGMEERASMIGADLEISSEPGCGTKVILGLKL